MNLSSTEANSVRYPAILQVIHHLSALLFALVVVGAVVASRFPYCEVVVDVVEPDVEVELAGEHRRIEGRVYEPWVRSVAEGVHELVVKRDGVVLHHEWFSAQSDKPVRLTAWNSRREHPSVFAPRP